jgi:BirA family biotin operon repressor/biotin-[acetyl-CoA-carboxylase] ligase
MIDLHVDWTDAARPGRRVGHVIEAHRVIGSTNDRARELLADPLVDGTVVVADEQTAGRGRGERTWYSPADHSLSMSAALRPRIAVADAWQLALGTALAASEACDPVAATGLKWPNDLIGADGRKVGGILIETIIEGDRLVGAVIGIGMNVDWRRAGMPDEIRDAATSLADLGGGPPIDRVLLLDRLLDRLSDELARLEDGQTPVSRYRARCRTLGEHVRVALGDRTVDGLAVEVDEGGALVVDSAAGRQRITSGEVQQVRGA